ncbi:MAG: hypothetical protein F4Y14_11720, partial [Acidobacteria bacterium]|nr:hypothetical protein [Acidobacteriota bacterium]
MDRPSLVDRCDPTLHRIVVLMAPGGFGKTFLLGECCRRAQADGRLVAWVTTDEHDDPETLVSYLALAFAESGAEFELDDTVSSPDPQRHRLDALLHWIGTIEGEVVIALDEVDRLEPASVALVDYMVWRGPANLHLAMAVRTRPRGLDIATPIVEGRGMVVSTDELRFRRHDIARYFETTLSRDQLRSLWEDSNGWPLAVCVQRNVADRFGEPATTGEVSLNWVETRLFRGLSPSDRDFILEVGLFEWADDELLERVLKGGARRRLRSLTPLVGLVQEVADGSFRLHPLLRRYAADALWRNARRRFRSVHRRIALVLAERGQVLEAMQHARDAEDPRLVGRILERAGAIRIGIRDGMGRLEQASQLVARDVMRRSPRLVLVNCGLLAAQGKVDQALKEFMALNERIAGEETGGRDRELEIDLALARGIFAVSGCSPIGAPETQALAAELEELARDDTADPIVGAAALFGLAVFAYEKAEFANAAALALRVRSAVEQTSTYLVMCADLLLGEIRLARGESGEAETVLSRAARVAKKDFAYDARPVLVGDALFGELDLERNRLGPLHHRVHSVASLATASAWLDVFVAATDIAAEMVARNDATRSLPVLAKALEFAQQTVRPRLIRCLAALQVSNLVRVGRTDEAHRVWRSRSLPTEADVCIDLEGQSWREMECICTARVRLLAASGHLHEAQSLGSAFAVVARDFGLVRSLTYANAAAIYAAWCGGDVGAAHGPLVENLELFDRTGYCRALLWHPESTARALDAFDGNVGSDLDAARDALLSMVSTAADADSP